MQRNVDFGLVRKALKFLNHNDTWIRDIAIKGETALDRIEEFVREVEAKETKTASQPKARRIRSRKI